MNKEDNLTHKLVFATEKILADAIAKKEKTKDAKYYLQGLLTPNEYLQTTAMKEYL